MDQTSSKYRGGGYLVIGAGYVLWLHGEATVSSKTDDEGLIDYKFYCFHGKPEFMYVSSHLDQHEKAHISFVDMDYKQAPFGRTDYKAFDELPAVPENFDKMKILAAQLSKDMPFLRVDFYEINHRIYFGELTFYPCAGFMPFKPKEWDKTLGERIILPRDSMDVL